MSFLGLGGYLIWYGGFVHFLGVGICFDLVSAGTLGGFLGFGHSVRVWD